MNKNERFQQLIDCYLAEFEACRTEMRQYLGAIQTTGTGAGVLFCAIISADQLWPRFPDALFALLPTIMFAAIMNIVMNLSTHQVLVLRCMQIEEEVSHLFDGAKPLWSQTFAAPKIQGLKSPISCAIASIGVVFLIVFLYGTYRAYLFQKWTLAVHLMELVVCGWTMFYDWRIQLRSSSGE